MASTRFAASVFWFMIIVLVFLAHEGYGASGASIAGRKVLRDGKMEVFMKAESDGKQNSDKFSESRGSEKVFLDATDKASPDEAVNVMHQADYDHDNKPPRGRRNSPINNSKPGN